MTSSRHTPIVLFLCVSNAGKSQMAEAIARQIAGRAIDARSAGTSPKTTVNELSARVVAESGADMATAHPKAIDADLLRAADRVVLLGTEVELAPVDGMRGQLERWPIVEPSHEGIDGIDRMRLIRDDINDRVVSLVMDVTGQPPEQARRYQQIVADLVDRFEGVFTEVEVRAAVRQAHAALAITSRIPAYLPVLVERFATDLLGAKAVASGRRPTPLPRLLFVCVHNAGRSQIAAALAKHLSGARVNVQSAGSRPIGSVNPVALEVLAERGIPAPDAFPKPLTDDVLHAADVVVTMGCGDECPYVPGKRYEDWPVADPDGADLETVRRITDDIQIRVTQLLAEVLDHPTIRSNS
ncbi:three-helix bundle dimerization domain-containing protein [Cumulibacter soli]|uniref:arsenate reductase/protein-tyrosine-phosphatase family protein n=1 Tax=Cumulibacter soli TaxID=2546344 RepID=UPI0010683DC3|nr:hypothetical protein [Cumulibacter soli]